MKSYIITLRGNEISERLSQECRAQAASVGIGVQVRDAINGIAHSEHFEKLKLRPLSNDHRKLKPGHFGNFLSHYYLWQECAQGTEPYLILEHDGYLLRPLPVGVLDKFTHVLKLDSENPGYPARYALIMQQQQKLQDTVKIQPTPRHPRMNKNAGYYSPGSYAYIIKPAACDLLLKWIATQGGFLSTDNQLGTGVVDLQECSPSVARLHPIFEQGENLRLLSTAG